MLKWTASSRIHSGGNSATPAGQYLRSEVDETPAYTRAVGTRSVAASPLRATFTTHRRALLSGFGLTIVWTVSSCLLLMFMPTFAVQQLHMDPTTSLLSNSLAIPACTVLTPVMGALSDHGNGTQHIFWNRQDVLVCSIHGDPAETAPFYAGYEDEVGGGNARGLDLNIPLPVGSGDPPFLDAVAKALSEVAAIRPAALVVPLGFDASEHDPHRTFATTDGGFQLVARRLAALNLPTLLVQEGGDINPERRASLGDTLAAFLGAFDAERGAGD